MMLQKKLVIGITAFIFSSIALGANAIQPAQSAKSSGTAQTAQSSQESQEPAESVLTPGARLVAGESENEFYILDKDEPMPVKTGANASQQDKGKKPDTAQLNTTLNTVKDKQLADNESVQQPVTGNVAADVTTGTSQATHKLTTSKEGSGLAVTSDAFETVIKDETAKETVSSVKQDKHKLAGKKVKVKTLTASSAVAEESADNATADESETADQAAAIKHAVHNKLSIKTNLARVKVVRIHDGHHFANRQAITKTRVALHRSTKHIAVKGSVDQIEVIPHTSVHHHKATASKKVKVHVETASKQAKHKQVSKKKSLSQVKVAINDKYKDMFKDTVTSPEIY